MSDPTPSHPNELPDFRLWALDQWHPPDGVFFQVAQLTNRNPLWQVPNHEFMPLESVFDTRALANARLYWVTAEMCELIDKASRSLPMTTLTQELVPCPYGLVFFEQHLEGLAAVDVFGGGSEIEVKALLWGESMIPPGPHKALGIASYAAFAGGLVSPAGRTDWEWGQDTDAPIDACIADDTQRVESMAEDRRWLATFFLLLSQTGVAAEIEVTPPRPTARRSQRANVTSYVRVVNVHAPKRPAVAAGEHPVDWTHRWVVEPHWRQQAYGPGHSLRRPKYIASFIKGPDDKPLIVKETVHVLKGT